MHGPFHLRCRPAEWARVDDIFHSILGKPVSTANLSLYSVWGDHSWQADLIITPLIEINKKLEAACTDRYVEMTVQNDIIPRMGADEHLDAARIAIFDVSRRQADARS